MICDLRETTIILADYMEYRASFEGAEMDLDVEFFHGHLHTGIRRFYGVLADEHGIHEDEQNPAAFDIWTKLQRGRA